MDIPILKEITIIFIFATVSLLLCSRIKVPGILGYLVTGLLVGPNGLGLVSDIHSVDIMAEIGVVLLLFTIGLEFSLSQLISLKRSALGGGLLQVSLTAIIFTTLCKILDIQTEKAIFYGLLISLSSTAIVLKLLMEKGEMESPFGRITTSVLIFQDIAIIPMMLITPMLLPGGTASIGDILFTLGKALVIVVLLFLAARFIVPKLLLQVTRTKSRELFLFSIVLICLVVAFITNKAGLSLALGAFLAGMVVSETGYGYQALGNVVPFKDVFTGFFFVSVGMLINIDTFLNHPILILVAALTIIIIKGTISGIVINIIGYPINTSMRTGISLAQVGEFSFILAASGAINGILSSEEHSIFIAISVLTMAATPFIIQNSYSIGEFFKKLPIPRVMIKGYFYEINPKKSKPIKDHIIIVGFGLAGKGIAKAATNSGILFNVIEMNPYTVKQEQKVGTNILYGDAAQEEVLHHAKIEHARAIVISGADNSTTKNIVETVHRINNKIAIIARTRFSTQVENLKDLGATDVISEEIETSVSLLSSVLKHYYVPLDDIEKLEAELRQIEPTKVKRRSRNRAASLGIKGVTVETITVPVSSPLSGHSLRELDVRFKYNVNVITLTSGKKLHISPGANHIISDRDELLVTGTHSDISKFAEIFNRKEQAE